MSAWRFTSYDADSPGVHASARVVWVELGYRGTWLIRNDPTPGPYSRPMPRALWWSQGVGVFL